MVAKSRGEYIIDDTSNKGKQITAGTSAKESTRFVGKRALFVYDEHVEEVKSN